MAVVDIVRQRLRAQRVVPPFFESPADVVAALCAVQAQDYRASLWGIGLRTAGATEADVERAVDARAIVRTWPMRGTLHFVAPEDARWMVRLLAPRVVKRSAGRHRQLGLDEATLHRSRGLLEKALQGDRQLPRREAYAVLERAGIATAAQRGVHILGTLAMQGVLCVSGHREKQPTFALLDEWVRTHRDLSGDEALGELAGRYFAGHGPATLADFAWWSGLTLAEAQVGLALAAGTLSETRIDGSAYWHAASGSGASTPKATSPTVHLFPVYDEYTVAYRDRSAFLRAAHAERAGNGIFSPVVAVGGSIAGTWTRRVTKTRVDVAVDLFAAARPDVRRALERAVARYGRFLGLPAVLA
jgi:hypothetical protein